MAKRLADIQMPPAVIIQFPKQKPRNPYLSMPDVICDWCDVRRIQYTAWVEERGRHEAWCAKCHDEVVQEWNIDEEEVMKVVSIS